MKYVEVLQTLQQIIFIISMILYEAHFKEMGLYTTKIPFKILQLDLLYFIT